MNSAANQPTRRDVLKWMSAIPFLPLGAMATAANLSGCNSSNDSTAINLKNATFTAMSSPTTAAAMATTTVASKLSVDWQDGTKTDYQLGYKSFFKTGESVDALTGGKIIAGSYFDINGQAIMDNSVTGQERQFFSDCPDGSSLLTVAGASVAGVTNPVFHVVQFEYTSKNLAGTEMYGVLPSPIAVLSLDQDAKTGHLTLKKYYNVDTSPAHGLWITCGASLSTWGTHLSSEEYEPDAFDQGLGGSDLATFKAFSKNLYGNETSAKVYNYGHLPEVTVNKDGSARIVKHYCMGRISHELIQMMPDHRTAIMGDDFTNGGLFMFVADKEKDLSAGTLYVAKYTSVLTESSTASIQWINLGHATSQEIDDLVNVSNIQARDIMDSVTTDPNDASYTPITLQKHKAWVKVKSGKEKAAAFLETHRYAAMKGGSMAFTKMEGTTVNVKDKVAYSAISSIRDSMVEGGSGYVASNNVKCKKISAGGVLAHDLKGNLSDDKGQLIQSDWVPYQSHMILLGEDITTDANGNTANIEKIASPDNLKYSENLRTLFIGEDTGMHLNNYLWAYQIDTKELKRILSCPAGAESTGLHAVDAINGWTYIMSNFQHAGDFPSTTPTALKENLRPLVNSNYNNGYAATVGYITADPIAPSVVKK